MNPLMVSICACLNKRMRDSKERTTPWGSSTIYDSESDCAQCPTAKSHLGKGIDERTSTNPQYHNTFIDPTVPFDPVANGVGELRMAGLP